MVDIKSFQCPNCGANLEYEMGDDHVLECEFCDSTVIVPSLKEESSGIEQDTPMEMMQELAKMVADNQKLDAVNLYQEIFDVGPGRASQAVNRMFKGKSVQIISGEALGGMPDLNKLAEIGKMIGMGKKIEAIKLYRGAYNVGLKEAKEAVEKMMRGESVTISSSSSQTYTLPSVHIDSNQIIPGTGKKAKKGCVGSLVGFAFMVGLILFPFFLISKFVPNDPFSRMFDVINPFSFAAKESSFSEEGIGPGYFQSAREVAVDNNGYIYMIDYGTGQVQVFDEQGEFVTLWMAEEDVYITGLTADRNGTVYVVYRGQTYLYDGATGDLLGQLTYLDDRDFVDVAVVPDGGLVALWGRMDNDLIRFDSQGNVVWVVESAISVHSETNEGDGRVTVDGLGNIYVVGGDNQAVFKFSSDGKFMTRFGSGGNGDGEFTSVSSIAVDHQGRVYVGDFWGIEVFDPEGRYLDTIVMKAYPYDLVFNDDDQLLVVMDNQVHVYNIRK